MRQRGGVKKSSKVSERARAPVAAADLGVAAAGAARLPAAPAAIA